VKPKHNDWFSFYENKKHIANIFYLSVDKKYLTFLIRTKIVGVNGVLKINPINVDDFIIEPLIHESFLNFISKEKKSLTAFEDVKTSISNNKFKILIKSPTWKFGFNKFLQQRNLSWAL